ncbi:hypothetical protein IVB18_49565 (plasmid) [Bradyrhizobium sp. 186]|uniref:hypothetical protein n=1 Tax=Bradyrhizobium sp. 186 TaxID=2782654 RepID=UPI00204C9905|nr:hypothetical protein IVB18_49565 [Bradyrhizobium sp. 186]
MLPLRLIGLRLRSHDELLAPGALLLAASGARASRRFCSRSKSAAALRAAFSLILVADRLFGSGRRLSLRVPPPSSPRSVGRPACSAKRPFDPAARLRTTPGFDMVAATTSGSSVSFGNTLMEEIAAGTPGLQGRDGEIIEASEV